MRFQLSPDAPHFDLLAWTQIPVPNASDPEATAGRTMTGANCYQYAIAGSQPDGRNNVYTDPREPITNPGTLGHLALGGAYTPQDILEHSAADGLILASTEELPDMPGHFAVPPPRPGYYVVGIYHKDRITEDGDREIDFHYVRQDRDGGWSEKAGSSPLSEVSRFLEPAADGGYQPLPVRHGEPTGNNFYTFAGYAYVPREGIDAGWEKAIGPEMIQARDNYTTSPVVNDFVAFLGDLYREGNEQQRQRVAEEVKKIRDTLNSRYGDGIGTSFMHMMLNDIGVPFPTATAVQAPDLQQR